MKPGELLRVRVAFGALGAVPIFLAGWLGWVQVAQAGTIDRRDGRPVPLVASTADSQGWKVEAIPAPRGSVMDRNGVILSADSPTYEVRASVDAPRAVRNDLAKFRPWVGRLVTRLATGLVSDQDGRDQLFERHHRRLLAAAYRAWRVDLLPHAGRWPAGHRRNADFLVAKGVDRLAVIEALRSDDLSGDYPTMVMHLMQSYRRVFPDRELTYGIVGHVATEKVELPSGRTGVKSTGIGLESFRALKPQASGRRRLLRDGRRNDYFVAPVEGAPVGAVMHATLDLELQRHAVTLLADRCEESLSSRSKKYVKWGAIVLVELDTGDVLASASWHRGQVGSKSYPQANLKASPFAPYQSLFEPGSIVKPLVFSYALEVGALDWSQSYDCNSTHQTYKKLIKSLGRRRPVVDDHDCSELTPHGIIVNSSNIGAAFVGLQLSRPQWQDYMKVYGFGQTLGLKLPHESFGGNHRNSFNPKTKLRGFRANSAISFSFGYEMMATAMQVSRAYLRMFRGLGADLRLVKAVEIDGVRHDLPIKIGDGPHYKPEVVDAVRLAMLDVVSNDEHATGSYVHRKVLKEKGIDIHGLIGGKTGTAESSVRTYEGKKAKVRNASFVGFLPADKPRWLAVCVLQNDVSAHFYGGRYAAPPAVELLLRCQQHWERSSLHQGSQFGSGGQTRHIPSGMELRSPGSSGWKPSDESGAFRDTR